MRKTVWIRDATDEKSCEWCSHSILLVAESVLGGNETVLCEQHKAAFMDKFHIPDDTDEQAKNTRH